MFNYRTGYEERDKSDLSLNLFVSHIIGYILYVYRFYFII